MQHDVFICHASEDKDDFVRPLAQALREHRLDVWYDEFVLTVGDSLRETIDQGLARSRFGIVILSQHFFTKRWPSWELNGLVARGNAGDRQTILPIWHNISRDEVLQYSPPLADLFAVPSSCGIEEVVRNLLRKIRPEEDSLVVARNFLIDKGLSPPSVTNEWWLDLVEIMEAQLRFPDLNLGRRWIFPLPFPDAEGGRERGLNIAWTALQMDWSVEGENREICQLTHPEQVHEFLQEWPGLLECARDNPSVLAMYAPQLTIPGFDTGLSDVFDLLLEHEWSDAHQLFSYGSPETTDGHAPLCGELIAWRHPTHGNYTAAELAQSFVHAHDGHYSRQLFDPFECLVWLLSDESNWMPRYLRETLLQGMRNRTHWWSNDVLSCSNHFSEGLRNHSRSKFKVTRNIRAAIEEMFTAALSTLNIQENPVLVAKRFIDGEFIDSYYKEQSRICRAIRERA